MKPEYPMVEGFWRPEPKGSPLGYHMQIFCISRRSPPLRLRRSVSGENVLLARPRANHACVHSPRAASDLCRTRNLKPHYRNHPICVTPYRYLAPYSFIHNSVKISGELNQQSMQNESTSPSSTRLPVDDETRLQIFSGSRRGGFEKY